MGDELTDRSASELAALIRNRTVSPVEVIEAFLARIDALDPGLHAFVTVTADQAVEDARRAADGVRRGRSLGPLHGVPVALKDEAWSAGSPATAGSLLFKRFVPSHDGTVAERLRKAGAVIIGKTNMPEFAAWPRSRSRVAGESVNPWDATRISGASSGGSAAAVAAGLVPIAIGSDGGGSTRIPAALCGVSGLFPTPGRVPCYGSFSYSPLGSLGPIARNVLDLALVEQVIAGPDGRDALALSELAPEVVVALKAGVQGLRVAWSPDFGRIPVDTRIATAGSQLLESLTDAGAQVDEITSRLEHPWGDGSFFAGRQAALAAETDELDDNPPVPEVSAEQIWMWEVFATKTSLTATEPFQSLCRSHVDLLAPPARMTYRPGSSPVGAPDSLPAVEDLKSTMRALLGKFDVICSPTMPNVAPVVPPGWATPYPDAYMGTNFTFIANSTGCPAASIPCGLVDGLPARLQVIGRPGDESTVLRVCQALETAVPEFPRPLMVQ